MCKCVENHKKEILEKCLEKKFDGLKADITPANVAWMFDGGIKGFSKYLIEAETVTKTGRPKTIKQKINMLHSYCPFCGEKYQGKEE